MAPSQLDPSTQHCDLHLLNLACVLGHRFGLDTLRALAQDCARRASRRQEEFEAEASRLAARLRAAGPAAALPPPRLQGWNAGHLRALQARHGGLLLALFHFGAHRQLIGDLALLGLPLVAPVSAQSRALYLGMCEGAPPALGAALGLLDVADAAIGRGLLKGLRQNRLMVLYADGDMGPTAEGREHIAFMGRRIAVKAGLARLALRLQLPVLPLFARESTEGAQKLVEGRLLVPGDPGCSQVEHLLGALWQQLAEEIERDPGGWEYAACLHRWLVPEAESPPATVLPGRLRLNTRRALPLCRAEGRVWMDLHSHRGFRIPPTLDALAAALERGECLELGRITSSQERSALQQLHRAGLLTQPA